MKPKDFKQVALALVQAVGKREAVRLIVMAGASPSVAEKLARGCYPSAVGTLLGRAINDAVFASKNRAS